MKKNEFKKMMRKENKSFKNYYIYELIIIIFLLIIVIGNVFVTTKNLIPTNLVIINTILIIIIAVPIIIIDLKNDKDIKEMYQLYIKENKIPAYKDKTKFLKVILVISIIVTLISGIITIKNITPDESQNTSNPANTLTITSNEGNVIETQYESFNGFKIKIPTEFNIMSDEIVNIKYPNGNQPSLVYTNDKTTINLALVINDVYLKNSEIEEYIKLMETQTKNYANNIEINFLKKSNHDIGELEFITPAEDTEIYNHIIAFSINDKLNLINFNCPKELMKEWQDIGDFIIDSIIFEENT